ncbi:hypothetical protein ACFSKN_11690 [Mariniflexile gromovii]|uniref:SpoIIAA-like protein n=1 Tax=Mariniflexile gromovii TaxID=362523 RepID=A0ABS4BWZ6_9FLAO|nr:hypothetical protein [Mariniflexile gromovii]MBP0904555.1 hypothetical protein [Mariniflexile gromovii]
MVSIKETYLYNSVIKELNYSFGNVFIFENFVVSEINRGVNFNWDDHGKTITEDVAYYLDTNGINLVYISHRINSYSVVASDWLKFFKHSYNLKGYYIVSENNIGFLNSLIENLFFNGKIKRFTTIEAAVNWVKIGINEVM